MLCWRSAASLHAPQEDDDELSLNILGLIRGPGLEASAFELSSLYDAEVNVNDLQAFSIHKCIKFKTFLIV